MSIDLNALERLEIREACERLALDYSFLADAGRMEEWSQLFADDGQMVMGGRAFTGPAGILAAVTAGERDAARLTVHAIQNHRIDILAPDRAEGSVYIVVFFGQRKDGGPAVASRIAPAMVGTYTDAYKKTSSGWKFARRAFEPLITTAPES
jgi:hypothetical protein